MNNTQWHSLPFGEVLRILSTRREGLFDADAEKRQKVHGKNSIPEKKKKTIGWIFLSQFHNSLMYILLGAAFISFILGDNVDALVILAAVVLNALVGFVQEHKAENALV